MTLALDLGRDKDTIFRLRCSHGQDELSTSSPQPQFLPQDLNFRLMQWRAVMQKPPPSLSMSLMRALRRWATAFAAILVTSWL